jgi:hypothetical protein
MRSVVKVSYQEAAVVEGRGDGEEVVRGARVANLKDAVCHQSSALEEEDSLTQLFH